MNTPRAIHAKTLQTGFTWFLLRYGDARFSLFFLVIYGEQVVVWIYFSLGLSRLVTFSWNNAGRSSFIGDYLQLYAVPISIHSIQFLANLFLECLNIARKIIGNMNKH